MQKKVLILGGTQFVGRHLCERLEKRDDLNVTLFHRGKTNPGLFPGFRHVHGDREADGLLPLAQENWDAIVDFSGYYPRTLRAFLSAIRESHQHNQPQPRYIFVSTISVYDLDAFSAEETISAQSPIVSWTEADETDTTMLTYGQRKAACEAVVQSFPEFNPVIFRPGLIYGPYDPTDRTYYWLWRQNQRKNLLVPDTLGLRSQMTFAPDFAQVLEKALFLNRIPEAVYLALTHSPLSLTEIFEAMRAPGISAPQLCPVSGDWLEKQDIRYWMDLPLTLPFERLFENAQLHRDFAGAFTPFAQSMALCRDYYAALGWPIPQTGLSPEREDAFLDALKS